MKYLKKIALWALSKTRGALTRIIDFLNGKKKDLPYREALILFLEKNLSLAKGKILDLGSGHWTWTKDKLATLPGCETISFDKMKTENVDVVGDIYELEKFFPADSFDWVVCTDVIEHVNEPFEAIKKISAVLKSGGQLLLSCPFAKSLHGEDYGDYWRITRQGWNELLKKYFKDIQISWLGEELMPKAYFIKATKI